MSNEIIHVPLSVIRTADKTNPRQNVEGIEGLAASIAADGLLQNLTVAANGKRSTYMLINGARRLAALNLLRERGDLPEDYEVPVNVLRGTGEPDRRRLGIVENLQRQDLHPLDEADAWLRLLDAGGTVQDLAERTGLSERTIRRRLALQNLCDEGRQAFRDGKMGLSQAQALSLGPHQRQQELLREMENGYRGYLRAQQIESQMTFDKPTLALAVFTLDQYTGTLTTNLFGDEDETYFDDIEQFVTLQKAEASRLAEEYRQQEGVEWVEEIEEPYRFSEWEYDTARKNAKQYGVVVHYNSRLGEVTVRTHLKKRPKTVTGRITGGANGDTPPPRPSYGPKLALEIGRHKTLAVQHELFANRRKAREVAAVRLLIGWSGAQRIHIGRADPHIYVDETRRADDPLPETFNFLDKQAQSVVLALYPEDDVESGMLALQELAWGGYDRKSLDLYERVKRLDDETLDTILVLLPVLTFGEQTGDSLDTRANSLFNRVARDLEVDMRRFWRPDKTFLGARTKDQLSAVARESGAVEALGKLPSKKGAMVDALLGYFQNDSRDAACNWLPGAMEFPARDEALSPVVEEEE